MLRSGGLSAKALSRCVRGICSNLSPPQLSQWWFSRDRSRVSRLVISHRGACGTSTEHTLAGYEEACEYGGDFIEFDIISTRDHQLIVMHDVVMQKSTNIALIDKFRSRYVHHRPVPGWDGDPQGFSGWFACDFTYPEIQTLNAQQPIPGRSSGRHDPNRFLQVPLFVDAVRLVERQRQRLNRSDGGPGLFIETKRSFWHREHLGCPLEEKLVQIVRENFGGPVCIISFEEQSLRRIASLAPEWPRVKCVSDFASGAQHGVPIDELLVNDSLLDKKLKHISTFAHGIAPWKDDLLEDPTSILRPNRLVQLAHEANLRVTPYTFRSDLEFLHPAYKGNAAAEYVRFFELGVDGVITDFTSHAVHAREYWRGKVPLCV
eukprot:gnl/Spiro4/11559_TR6103_c0_g1_i1.p1 gnl/Spiro4/11559_TR6103_c0_g1~~gnl/Spiro4/11559_TR6103_c0_g1_i1.p1  ORF type:complete len:376 (-),score=49.25 gnl/Spiro4/11559_TR6103_c0_g1_i1:46-1173(-)